MQRVAQHASGRAANPFESALRGIAVEAGVLGLEPQVVLECVGGRVRPDLLHRRLRLVAEADSFEWHGRRRALRTTAAATTTSWPTGGLCCGSRGSRSCSTGPGCRGPCAPQRPVCRDGRRAEVARARGDRRKEATSARSASPERGCGSALRWDVLLRTSTLLPAHPAGGPGRRRAGQPQAARARRLHPPRRPRRVHLAAAGPAGAEEGRAHRPRGDGRDRRAGGALPALLPKEPYEATAAGRSTAPTCCASRTAAAPTSSWPPPTRRCSPSS